MNEERLKMLRKKHLIQMNMMALIGFGIFMLLLYNGITTRAMWISLILLTVFQLLFIVIKDMPIITLFSKDWRELQDYEKTKLGGEWKKQKKMHITSQMLLIVIGVFNAMVAGPNNKMLLEGNYAHLFYIFLFIILLLLINVSTVIHNRKLDKNENLEGYTKNMFKFSIITAIIFIIIVFTGMVLFLFSY
ncbi:MULTISPECIES: hypothetical protein [unclassified Bacillus (in: firmicutes)]|uniref:hypothetical protein n=1 Tax=unclassified Bacillus (in: firmicutes) TaxID=185979 RepID=UPI0008E660CD|nr:MULTISPECIES: hypothetical protein [unclassified Bacillus (in: firmicutes)]SFA70822.1 hypothetical protein SAMN02799634_101151 [Bacillus sp. UNCCL13]SFQ60805.1 hypothetical protein SAMN04488577_0436 [Bacillus sp. cl95]